MLDRLLKLTQFFMGFITVCTKREVSSTVKLLLFKSVFVPIMTYDPESWVMTETILSQAKV